MVKFVCDNDRVKAVLQDLCALILDDGGFIHDDLCIVCDKGQLKLTGPKSILNQKHLLLIPSTCFVPIDRFVMGAAQDKIIIRSHDDSLDQIQVRAAELMVDLYNATDKLALHKNVTLLSLYYEDHNFFQRLMGGYRQDFLQILPTMSEEDAYCYDFLNVRGIAYDENEQDKGIQKTSRLKAIIPVLDCINHSSSAPSLYRVKTRHHDKYQFLVAVQPYSLPQNEEFFVNYGSFYDSYHFFVQHGYVAARIPFVKSIPLEVQVPGLGELHIAAKTHKPEHTALPEEIEDLQFFLPEVRVFEKGKKIHLSFLYIPQQNAPKALRRILLLAFDQISESREKAWNSVLFAERVIIQENTKHYSDLKQALEAYTPSLQTQVVIHNAKEVMGVQLEKIKNYPFYDEAMGKEE